MKNTVKTVKELNKNTIKDFNMFGVMIDCSRNAVMNVEEVKRFAAVISKMRYNTLMLYTEDTYEVKNEPLFGAMRGRYSINEIKEIDSFCKSINIELIPCIQTLAHLSTLLQWPEYNSIRDIDDILLIDDERTYKLINNMFASLREAFSTNKIHIGMDEAHHVGLGTYFDKHGIKPRFELINHHLQKVLKIAKNYSFEPMLWSDMFIKFAFNTNNYYCVDTNNLINTESKIPTDASLVYWDYYSTDYEHYKNLIAAHKKISQKIIFAGGIWSWVGFAPSNEFSISTTTPALKACRDFGIKDVILTMWGDNGSECSKNACLSPLFYASELAKGNSDINNIKEKFKNMFNIDFDSFMLLDYLNRPSEKAIANPCKYMLFNDPFTGLNDYLCSYEDNDFYINLSKKIADIKDTGEYGYIFEEYKKLCDVLAIKCNLGLKTRDAYKSGNKEKLKELAINDYEKAIKLIEEFHSAFQNVWFKENKPYGFDIQDIRLGGLIMRLKTCKNRLISYIEGTASSIPELEEPQTSADYGKHWGTCATPNSLN